MKIKSVTTYLGHGLFVLYLDIRVCMVFKEFSLWVRWTPMQLAVPRYITTWDNLMSVLTNILLYVWHVIGCSNKTVGLWQTSNSSRCGEGDSSGDEKQPEFGNRSWWSRWIGGGSSKAKPTEVQEVSEYALYDCVHKHRQLCKTSLIKHISRVFGAALRGKSVYRSVFEGVLIGKSGCKFVFGSGFKLSTGKSVCRLVFGGVLNRCRLLVLIS